MEKSVVLTDNVNDSTGQVIARMRVVLTGDGSTPNIMTMGTNNPIGFKDDGSPIFPDIDETALKDAQQKMMAEAIKTQKELTEANGGDSSTVNMIGAEKENKDEQTN